jgi:hypothetical protein
MIGNGYYDANMVTWGLIESKSESNPEQFAIEFEIAEGEHAGETITWFGFFSDAAFPYTMEKIRKAGLVGDDLRKLARSSDGTVRIGVKVEEYNGEARAKVSSIGGGSVVASKALPADRAASFSERMRSRIKAWDAQSGTTTGAAAQKPAAARNGSGAGARARPAPAAGHEPDDSDIPF